MRMSGSLLSLVERFQTAQHHGRMPTAAAVLPPYFLRLLVLQGRLSHRLIARHPTRPWLYRKPCCIEGLARKLQSRCRQPAGGTSSHVLTAERTPSCAAASIDNLLQPTRFIHFQISCPRCVVSVGPTSGGRNQPLFHWRTSLEMSRARVGCFALTVVLTAALPIDDYVSKADPHYGWYDTGVKVTGMLFGGTAHILNVTSQQWLDPSRAVGPHGHSIWSHQVAVIVPKHLEVTNVSMSIMTGGCNKDVKPPSKTEEYLEVASALASRTNAIVIVIYQIPNCPITYPSDPQRRGREEDEMIAWAWREYLIGKTSHQNDTEWLPRFPMAKAGMQCMRAAAEFAAKMSFAKIDSWVVSGASKRGWTSWMVSDLHTQPFLNAQIQASPASQPSLNLTHSIAPTRSYLAPSYLTGGCRQVPHLSSDCRPHAPRSYRTISQC